jgi:hypothetical protein
MVNDKFGNFIMDAGVRADRVIDQLEIRVEGEDPNIKRLESYPSAHLGYVQDWGTLPRDTPAAPTDREYGSWSLTSPTKTTTPRRLATRTSTRNTFTHWN